MAVQDTKILYFFIYFIEEYYEFQAENSHHSFQVQGEQPGWGEKVDHGTENSNLIRKERIHCEECTGWLVHLIHGLWPLGILLLQLCGIQSIFYTFPGYFWRVIFSVNIIYLSKVQESENKNHLSNGYFP